MTHTELKRIIEDLNLSPSDAAKVLCIQKSKMSEYLKGEKAGGRKMPCYLIYSIEALQALSITKRKIIFKKRLI